MKTKIEINPPKQFPCIAIDSRDGSVVVLNQSPNGDIEAVILLSVRDGRDAFSAYKVEGTWPYKFFPDKLVLSNEHIPNQER